MQIGWPLLRWVIVNPVDWRWYYHSNSASSVEVLASSADIGWTGADGLRRPGPITVPLRRVVKEWSQSKIVVWLIERCFVSIS